MPKGYALSAVDEKGCLRCLPPLNTVMLRQRRFASVAVWCAAAVPPSPLACPSPRAPNTSGARPPNPLKNKEIRDGRRNFTKNTQTSVRGGINARQMTTVVPRKQPPPVVRPGNRRKNPPPTVL